MDLLLFLRSFPHFEAISVTLFFSVFIYFQFSWISISHDGFYKWFNNLRIYYLLTKFNLTYFLASLQHFINLLKVTLKYLQLPDCRYIVPSCSSGVGFLFVNTVALIHSDSFIFIRLGQIHTKIYKLRLKTFAFWPNDFAINNMLYTKSTALVIFAAEL